MITAILFSKDRPPQLDLCLRSLRLNLPWLKPLTVIWTASNRAFEDGYTLCEATHPAVRFERERDFHAQVLEQLALVATDLATFICDDDVAYRPASVSPPAKLLAFMGDILCFSLRLGANTHNCYSLRRPQRTPTATATWAGTFTWQWPLAEADYAYPGSLDGHLFRTWQLRRLVESQTNWRGPNELEDALNRACQTALLPKMAAFDQSCLVNVPSNMVQATHQTNRYGERFHSDPVVINDRYLRGAHLSLDSVKAKFVDAAHVEFDLRWAA